MGKKISKLLKGQTSASVFYILFGLCLVLMPVGTVNLLCKVIFGLVMIFAGLYRIYVYAGEKENTTLLDLFSGVIVLVIGGFLFANPQIVVKLLPTMLGAFVVVDSIWMLRGCRRLKKRRQVQWKIFLGVSLLFIILGIVTAVYPFDEVKDMVLFAGYVFLANGLLDVIFYIFFQKMMKKSPEEIEADILNREEKRAKKAAAEEAEKAEKAAEGENSIESDNAANADNGADGEIIAGGEYAVDGENVTEIDYAGNGEGAAETEKAVDVERAADMEQAAGLENTANVDCAAETDSEVMETEPITLELEGGTSVEEVVERIDKKEEEKGGFVQSLLNKFDEEEEPLEEWKD